MKQAWCGGLKIWSDCEHWMSTQ